MSDVLIFSALWKDAFAWPAESVYAICTLFLTDAN
jgi:hypothetical protein